MKKRVLGLLEVVTKERTDRVGRTTEYRFLEAMLSTESVIKMPEWVKKVYVTEPCGKEDMQKIDAVVETDVGRLYLQIKSSDKGAAKHFRKISRNDARKRFIGVVVVRGRDTIDEIRRNAKIILESIHTKIVHTRL